MGELAVEREGVLEVQRTCSEADSLHQWVDAPQSSEWALWRGDGQCCIYVYVFYHLGKQGRGLR